MISYYYFQFHLIALAHSQIHMSVSWLESSLVQLAQHPLSRLRQLLGHNRMRQSLDQLETKVASPMQMLLVDRLHPVKVQQVVLISVVHQHRQLVFINSDVPLFLRSKLSKI